MYMKVVLFSPIFGDVPIYLELKCGILQHKISLNFDDLDNGVKNHIIKSNCGYLKKY